MRYRISSSAEWFKKIRKNEITLGKLRPDLASMLAAGEVMAMEVRRLLNLPGSGKIYSEGYQASAPGEPPARKSGNLADSVVVAPFSETMVGVGIEGAPYWKHQEFGTRKMQPRPFIRPAIANARHAASIRYAVGLKNSIRAWIRQRRSR